MDIFYDEVRWPTRALQQEEEEDAAAIAEQDLLPPAIKWIAGQACQAPQLLVVATSPASCSLLTAVMGQVTQPAGHVQLPDHAPAAADGPTRAQLAALYCPVPGVLVCCCEHAVPPQRAPAWARGVMQGLQPARVVVFGTIQAEQYRGEADASQELLAFVLRSTAALQQQAAAPKGSPFLPSGSIVSGLPAALLTQAELAGTPAELLVVVEQVPSLVPETLALLAQRMAGVLMPAGEQKWCAQLGAAEVVGAARSHLQRTAYRPSAVYS